MDGIDISHGEATAVFITSASVRSTGRARREITGLIG